MLPIHGQIRRYANNIANMTCLDPLKPMTNMTQPNFLTTEAMGEKLVDFINSSNYAPVKLRTKQFITGGSA